LLFPPILITGDNLLEIRLQGPISNPQPLRQVAELGKANPLQKRIAVELFKEPRVTFMPNFLEQLAAEWYEYQGFFVRRNIKVGKRAKGGHEGELDVVAFSPTQKRLVHIETSMDSDNWADREKRFARKFATGQKHIPILFSSFAPLPKIEAIALLGIGSNKNHTAIGGAHLQMVCELLREIRDKIPHDIASQVVPEQYVILRTLQFAAECWGK
jgi:hypothetical protein